ncbi:MAG: tetratricopeptide repeat protein [Alphaproteobacteria bacterium]
MKFAFSLLSIALLVETGHACLGDMDIVRRYHSGALYKDNFNDKMQCIASPNTFADLHAEFTALRNRFPYDRTLAFYHARAKMMPDSPHFAEGINEFCHLMYVEDALDEFLPLEMASELVGYLASYVVANRNIGDEFRIVAQLYWDFKDLSEDLQTNPRRNAHNQHARRKLLSLETQLGNSFKDLYSFLKTNQAIRCADGLVFTISNSLIAGHFNDLNKKIITSLYLLDDTPSDYVKMSYVQAIRESDKYAEIIDLSTPLVGIELDPDLPFQSAKTCNVLLVARCEQYLSTQFENAHVHNQQKDLLRKQISLLEDLINYSQQNNVSYLHNITYCYLDLGDYEKALETFSKIKNLPQDVLAKSSIKRGQLEELHQYLADKTNNTEIAAELLLARQQRALNKNKKIASCVKHYQESLKTKAQNSLLEASEKKLSVSSPAHGKRATSTQKDVTNLDIGVTDKLSNVSTPHETSPSSKPATESLQIQKTKKKTRPQLKQKVNEVHPQTKTQATEQTYLCVEDVTTNKRAIATFNALFSKYLPSVKSDKKVNISLHEIQGLFKALGQNYDPQAGKGSHKKGTLKFEKTTTFRDEQMVILTKSTYLKPYLIKKLREGFIKAGVLPKNEEIIGRLRREGLLYP